MDSAVDSRLSSLTVTPDTAVPAELATDVAADTGRDTPAELASPSEVNDCLEGRCLFEPLLLVLLNARLLAGISGPSCPCGRGDGPECLPCFGAAASGTAGGFSADLAAEDSPLAGLLLSGTL